MSRRDRIHEVTREEIKAIARRHMAVKGNEALSLRAIAREMEMTAPALYRYFASRDELITALILDAFTGFADAMLEADRTQIETHGPNAYGPRLSAVMLAYRAWALEHPTDFALIYGTPIPDYHAPEEPTAAASGRGIAALIRVVAEAWQAGALRVAPEMVSVPPTVETAIQAFLERNQHPTTVSPFYIGIIIWSRIHGLVMLELFHHTTPVVQDAEAMYQAEVSTILSSLGLAP